MTSQESKIEMLLEIYNLEEALEVLDITPEYCIEILLEGGHCVLPDYLDDGLYREEEGDEAEA